LESHWRVGDEVDVVTPDGLKRRTVYLGRQLGHGDTAVVHDLFDEECDDLPFVVKLYTRLVPHDVRDFVVQCDRVGLTDIPTLDHSADVSLTEYSPVAGPIHLVYHMAHLVGITALRVDPERFIDLGRYCDSSAVGELRRSVRIALRLTYTIHEIHTRGFVVGDLSHANVLVDQDGALSIIDVDSFGIETGAFRRPAKYVTLNYRAPEVGVDGATQSSDRFCLAILVCRLLMDGRHPFEGVDPSDDTGSIQGNIDAGRSWLRDTSIQLPEEATYSKGLRDLPPGLAAELHQLLDPDPENRPKSVAPLIRVLGEAESRMIPNACGHYVFEALECARCRRSHVPASARVYPPPSAIPASAVVSPRTESAPRPDGHVRGAQPDAENKPIIAPVYSTPTSRDSATPEWVAGIVVLGLVLLVMFVTKMLGVW